MKQYILVVSMFTPIAGIETAVCSLNSMDEAKKEGERIAFEWNKRYVIHNIVIVDRKGTAIILDDENNWKSSEIDPKYN